MSNTDDRRRLDWLLTLLRAATGPNSPGRQRAVGRLWNLRRRLLGDEFPFRSSIDAEIEEDEAELRRESST